MIAGACTYMLRPKCDFLAKLPLEEDACLGIAKGRVNNNWIIYNEQ